MSRVAKAVVILPKGVQFKAENEVMTVTGPLGSIEKHYNSLVDISTDKEDNNRVIFKPKGTDPKGWAQSGTANAIFRTMVEGVTKGFKKGLELVGVGYRAQASGSKITLSLGFSHPVEFALPKGVTAVTPNNTTIELSSIDKQLLGQVASNIRSFRPPEPYKGKGIKYQGEVIARKEAKKK